VGDMARTVGEASGPAPSPATPHAGTPPAAHSTLISGILQTLALAIALIAFGVIAWLYLGILPLRGRTLPMPFARSALQAAVEESLDDLRHMPDARLAIIRCYGRFERVLASVNMRRSPWETAFEFMRTALRHPRLPREGVRELTRLFEIARFSQHELGLGDRERAWQALVAVKTALDKEDLHASPS
jgi:hypothetical protein